MKTFTSHPTRFPGLLALRRLTAALKLASVSVLGFMTSLTPAAAAVPGACTGKVLNPITDICWSCMFPMKLAGGIPVSTTGAVPDVETDARPVCVCGENLDVSAGLNLSFWEPLRTAEVVRHAGCLPSLGGAMIDLDAPDHGRSPADTESDRSTAFWQVHWYHSPWAFVVEAVLDTSCLEQAPWDLAYLSELDPLWDDTLSSFLLAPDAALFTNAAAGAACAVDCVKATVGTAEPTLYWCAGCQGSLFPLSGWMAAQTSSLQAWHLMAQRFAMKLSREGILWSAHGAAGQCGPYPQPLFRKDVWRTQLVFPSRTTGTNGPTGACCYPIGRSTAIWGSMKTPPVTGEDGAILLFRKRDCCVTKSLTSAATPDPAFLEALAKAKTEARRALERPRGENPGTAGYDAAFEHLVPNIRTAQETETPEAIPLVDPRPVEIRRAH